MLYGSIVYDNQGSGEDGQYSAFIHNAPRRSGGPLYSIAGRADVQVEQPMEFFKPKMLATNGRDVADLRRKASVFAILTAIYPPVYPIHRKSASSASSQSYRSASEANFCSFPRLRFGLVWGRE